jgi:hypothetical protein
MFHGRPNLDRLEEMKKRSSKVLTVLKSALAPGLLAAGLALACQRTGAQSAATDDETNSPIARIRKEGLENSHVTQLLSYLSDVIGQRLTGSPSLHRANEWTRQKLASWGLTNAHLERWGPFGRGWALQRFSAQVIEPYSIPLIACPNAWSPGFDHPLVAEVVYIDSMTNADQYKGKLAGAIVLAGAPREIQPHFEALALRLADTNLLRLANAAPNQSRFGGGPGARRGQRGGRPFRGGEANRLLGFLAKEHAGLVVHESPLGDGGTVFVAAASVPGASGRGGEGATNAPRAWSIEAPAMPAQITVAAEDYNRLVRMIQQGEKLKMEVNLQVRFYAEDPMAYNTIAEIAGGDLRDEIVMLGGHLDSWQSGTGATDNGAGVASTMEAMRILAACNLHPRRTIRIGLWTGEEQGILGSKAYVTEHFGYYTNAAMPTPRASADTSPRTVETAGDPADAQSQRRLVREYEYDKLSVYFNLDNGAGKIRGVYMQNNEAVRPIFRRWLEPFRDLGAETLTVSNTGSTDHVPFDAVGLPGFEFIQDPLDYSSRSHHSNEDVFDRIVPDDLKQASVILAAFAYDAAMADSKLPRKPAQ